MSRRKMRIVPLSNTSDLFTGPINLSNGFSIRDISGMLTADTFRLWESRLSKEDLSNLLAWDLCLVHEFQSDLVLGQEETLSLYLTRFVVAAFRWLRATETTDTWFVQGFLSPKDSLTIPTVLAGAENIDTLVSAQFSARSQHIFLEDFETRAGLTDPQAFREASSFLPQFKSIVADMILKKYSYTPIVMAVRLAEQAYLEFDLYIRFLKRIMALEALFSTDSTFGKKALVPRIPKFLGESVEIYPGRGAPYTTKSVIDDLLTLRNKFAHGDSVPANFLSSLAHPAVMSTNVQSYADVLREASAVILKNTLLKIFHDGLAETFSDKSKMEALF